MAMPISQATPLPPRNFAAIFTAAAEEGIEPTDDLMSFEGAPENHPSAANAGGEDQTRASEVTPPGAGNNEENREVNSPARRVEQRHLPPSSATPADPAMMAGPSITLDPSTAAHQLPSAPAPKPDVVLVQEAYESMSMTPSEAASTLHRRDKKKSWTNPILTAA